MRCRARGRPRQWLSSAWAVGPGPPCRVGLGREFTSPTIAPQNPAARLLVGDEDFDNARPISRLTLIMYFLMFGLFHLHRRCTGLRGIPLVFSQTVPFNVPVFEARLHENLLILWLQVVLGTEPKPFCL